MKMRTVLKNVFSRYAVNKVTELTTRNRISGSTLRRRKICMTAAKAAETYTSELPPTLYSGKSGLKFVDTHCHLDMILNRLNQQEYETWRNELPEEEKFESCITIGCSLKALDPTELLMHKEGVFAAFGIHPLSAHEWSDEVSERLQKLLRHPHAVALGECGLDYHYEADPKVHALQQEVFTAQMRLAGELDLPLVVHTREAEEDTLRLMTQNLPTSTRVHVHCFTSSATLASQLLDLYPNLFIGFTGVVTFKNAQEIRDVVKIVPLDRILLETDGPFMAPVPHRGKVAHPGYIPKIASVIAEVKNVSFEDVINTTRQNAWRMYGI